ncbi:hypothetical protein MOUN0_M06260 [Monosporozyma unispora]|nr:hypothetical protein C6P44_000169 [Kazachstania unispora]
MLRTSTSSILQSRKNNRNHTNHTILRSRRNIPQYQDTLINEVNNMNGYTEENRYGDFNVLNESNHPGVVYYFVEVANPEVTTSSSSSGVGGVGNNGSQNGNVNGSI